MFNKTLTLRHSVRGLQVTNLSLLSTRVFEAATEDGASFVVTGDDVECFLNNNGFEVFPTGTVELLIQEQRRLSERLRTQEKLADYLEHYLQIDNLTIHDDSNLRTDQGSSPEPHA